MNLIIKSLKWLCDLIREIFIGSHAHLQVLYSSASYLIVNKQHDMLINSDTVEPNGTLQTLLSQRFPYLTDGSLAHKFRFVHRLDYSTSGAICIALHRKAASNAMTIFQNRKAHKYYLAIVRGHLSQDKMTIGLSIGKDDRPDQGHRMCSGEKPYCGSPRQATTNILVLERGICYGYPATKVLLKPVTGRRHQLRVHCESLGHTIVGDFTYSGRKDVGPWRMFLHSHRLVLPFSSETVDVRTSDPFTSRDARNRWTPVEFVHGLDEDAFNML